MRGSRSSFSSCRPRSSSGGSSSRAAGRADGGAARANRRPGGRRWRFRRAGASAPLVSLRPVMSVRELDLDLDAFEGPFDLLLALVLREELPLAEVDVAGIVVAFVERLGEREELDLEACGEFLVLVASLLELKARGLFDDEADLEDLAPEEAAEELARRLEEYRRIKEAAAGLAPRPSGGGKPLFPPRAAPPPPPGGGG